MAEAWHFDPELDTAKSYELFQVYLESPSLESAYEAHHKRSLNGQRAPGTACKWSIKGRWVDRKNAYLASVNQKIIEGVREKEIEKRLSELEQYRQSADQIAKLQIQTLHALETLVRNCLIDKDDRQPKAAEEIDIKTLKDFLSASQAHASKAPFELWAKSMQIDKMQEQLNRIEAMQNESDS